MLQLSNALCMHTHKVKQKVLHKPPRSRRPPALALPRSHGVVPLSSICPQYACKWWAFANQSHSRVHATPHQQCLDTTASCMHTVCRSNDTYGWTVCWRTAAKVAQVLVHMLQHGCAAPAGSTTIVSSAAEHCAHAWRLHQQCCRPPTCTHHPC
jgi:hypothetical protein